MKTLIRLFLVVLLLPRKVADRIPFVRAILQALTGNPRFPNPDPPLPQAQSALADYEEAEAACKTRTKGTVQTRNERWAILKDYLKRLARFVQTVANANPAEGESIIQGAGMKAKRIATRPKPDLEVLHGEVSGEVVLIATSASHSAAYEWQYSTDQKTWTDVRHTMQARTTVRGLTPGATYWFRYRTLTRRVDGDWHQPVSLIVT